MSIQGQGHSLTLVKGHSDLKVKCLTFGQYTQVSDSGPLGPLVGDLIVINKLCKFHNDCSKNEFSECYLCHKISGERWTVQIEIFYNIQVQIPPKSWDFFQPHLLCFVLCYGFHVVTIYIIFMRERLQTMDSD